MPILGSNPDDIKAYDEFVRGSEYSRISQDRNWEYVKKGWTGDYVYLEEKGEIVAALSILSVNSVDGKKLSYANRGPVCDFYDAETVIKLIEEAKPILEKHNSFLLRLDPEVRFDEELVGAYRRKGFDFRSRETNSHDFVQPRYNMILSLKGKDEEVLLAEFSPKTRYNIKIAEKKGVKTEYIESAKKGSEEEFNNAIDVFYKLTEIMAKRNGITFRPKDYFIRMF